MGERVELAWVRGWSFMDKGKEFVWVKERSLCAYSFRSSYCNVFSEEQSIAFGSTLAIMSSFGEMSCI